MTQPKQDKVKEQYRKASDLLVKLFGEEDRSGAELDTVCFLMKLVRSRAAAIALDFGATVEPLPAVTTQRNKRWSGSDIEALTELWSTHGAVVVTDELIDAAHDLFPTRTRGSAASKLYEVRAAAKKAACPLSKVPTNEEPTNV